MIEIQYLGQCGFRINIDDKIMCFDLYMSDQVYKLTGMGKRNYAPPILAEDMGIIDYYFISHDHLDHLDIETIKMVLQVSNQIVFFCPYPHMHILESAGVDKGKIVGMKANQIVSVGNIEIMAIPQKHEEYMLMEGEHGNLGYVIKYDNFQFYFAGDVIADQILADTLKNIGKMDIMFLPINGHDWNRKNKNIMGNMTYREALDLCNYVGTDLVVPMHYDLFADNTENPAYFVDYLYKMYPYQKFKMFIPGETVVLI